MNRTRPYYGWIVLASGFAVFTVGYAMRNTFSVFYPVIVSDFGWTRSSTAVMYSIALLSYGMFAPVAGGLADRFKPQYVLATGGLIVGGGIALCGAASSTWYFYVVFGVVVAIGTSLMGLTPLASVLTHWFGSNRSGMVFGLLGAGYGVSLVSAPLFQWLISDHGWRSAYVIIGLGAVALVVPLSLLLIRRSPQQQSLVDSDNRRTGSSHGTETVPEETHQWTVREAVHTRSFRFFLLVGFCNMGLALQVVIAHQVYCLQDLGYPPLAAATMFGVFGVAIAAGNVTSTLSDRFGRVRFFVAGSAVAVIGILLLRASPESGSAVIPMLFAVFAGWGLGTSGPTCYAAMADRFHGRHYGAIQGTAIFSMSLGGAIGPWLGGYLHDVTGNYHTTLVLAQVFVIAAAVFFALATRIPVQATPCE